FHVDDPTAETKRAAVGEIAAGWNLPALDSLHIEDSWEPILWVPITSTCRKPLSRVQMDTFVTDNGWEENFDRGQGFHKTTHQVPDLGVIWVIYDSLPLWREGCPSGISDHFFRLGPATLKHTEWLNANDCRAHLDRPDWGALRHLHIERDVPDQYS